MARRRISVVIVDDSAFMRKALRRMLSSEPGINVVADAPDGPAGIQAVKLHRPDLVTMDVQMPGMNGVEAVRRIMAEVPTPIIMISSITNDGADITLKALEAGAIDFIDKSSCKTTLDILDIRDALVEKVKVVAGVDLGRVSEAKKETAEVVKKGERAVRERRQERFEPSTEVPSHIVAIGSSTGGPMSLEKVLVRIPEDYPGAILIVQHMPPGFTKSLADRMNGCCAMRVKEAEEGDLVVPGSIYIAPSGLHMKLRRVVSRYKVELSRHPLDAQYRPSVDVLFDSVAQNWPGKMMAVVLTGMGDDGARGVRSIKNAGGLVLAQSEETCVVYGMPKAALATGAVDRMIPLDRVYFEIARFGKECLSDSAD